MLGFNGTPLKINKIGSMGSVEEVVSQLISISKGMTNPQVLRIDDTIAVFDMKPIPDLSNLRGGPLKFPEELIKSEREIIGSYHD